MRWDGQFQDDVIGYWLVKDQGANYCTSSSLSSELLVRTNLHNKICRTRLFVWRMQCCLKGSDPVYDPLC